MHIKSPCDLVEWWGQTQPPKFLFTAHRLLEEWTDLVFLFLTLSSVPYHKKTHAAGSPCCKGRIWESKPLQKYRMHRSEHPLWDYDTKLLISAENSTWCYTKFEPDISKTLGWQCALTDLISTKWCCTSPSPPNTLLPHTTVRDSDCTNSSTSDELNTKGSVFTPVKQKAIRSPPGSHTEPSMLRHIRLGNSSVQTRTCGGDKGRNWSLANIFK